MELAKSSSIIINIFTSVKKRTLGGKGLMLIDAFKNVDYGERIWEGMKKISVRL
jgi:hypothetical protein